MKVLCLLLCTALLPVLAEELPSFQRGNVLYTQRDFARALEAYQEIEGVSAALDFNMGNTLMRMNRTDEAIAHYRRAQWLSPHDPDLERNFSQAAERLSVAVPEPPLWRRLTGWWGPSTWQRVFILSCWLLGGLGIASSFIPVLRTNRLWLLPPALGLVLLCGLGTWASLPSHFTNEAVIRDTDAVTRFEPLPDATEKQKIPGGSIVSILETQRDWIRIQSGDLTGWIQEDDLIRL